MCKVKRRRLYLLPKHFLDSVILQVLKLIYVSQLNDSFSNGSNSRSLCALSVLLRRWHRLRPLRRFAGFKGGGRPSGIPPTLVLCLCKRVGFHASLYIFMYTFCQSLIGYSRRSQCETSVTLGPPRQATINREFTKRRRRQLRKRHLKSEFALPQTLLCLFHPV